MLFFNLLIFQWQLRLWRDFCLLICLKDDSFSLIYSDLFPKVLLIFSIKNYSLFQLSKREVLKLKLMLFLFSLIFHKVQHPSFCNLQSLIPVNKCMIKSVDFQYLEATPHQVPHQWFWKILLKYWMQNL